MAAQAEALFAAVYARPHDDAPRRVLADFLQEQGDPRGEFIALQLKGTSLDHRHRAEQLLKVHRDRWVGPLAGVVRPVAPKHEEWKRGFLATCWAAPDASVAHEPAWATVEELHLEGGVLLSERMTSLRVLTGLQGPMAEQLFCRLPPFTGLERLLWHGPAEAPGFELRPQAVPGLRELQLSSMGPWLWDAPLLSQLRSLRLRLERPLPLLAVWRAANERRLTLDSVELAHAFGRLRLSRDDRGDFSQLRFEFLAPAMHLNHFTRAIEELPRDALSRFDFWAPRLPPRKALQKLQAVLDAMTRVKSSWR